MKLSKRERVLLIIFGCVSVLALSWFLLFQPQLLKLEALQSENVKLEKEKVQVASFPDTIKKLDSNLSQMLSDTEKKSARFFPDIQQDRLILILDDVLKKSQLQSLSITCKPVALTDFKSNASGINNAAVKQFPLKDYVNSFNEANGGSGTQNSSKATGAATAANKETAGQTANGSASGQNQTQSGNQIETMNVTIQYKGTYPQLISFVKGIEGLNRTITIEKLTSGTDQGGLIKGSIIMDFYGLPKFQNQDKEFMNWPLKNEYGKDNPF
jgi:type IV pilus assembly protein PilO